ncbi:hypothetical protein B0T26DRAFT_681691 [Lasiosphaeria miniovina]|uniref:Uncharacterized protein n=1 Tax=Lasiosphaeria miniovina TaxID=1954250 RepID=A0AA39ZUR5_9PEZI|nr:uncharacterized protein B0T26DRAFT_681691 [Lasiosphaeria miniovina]KAK0704084.1 hypothetical protein B0T26DRAFT_681691 [Lasiosphaeria miniovina]
MASSSRTIFLAGLSKPCRVNSPCDTKSEADECSRAAAKSCMPTSEKRGPARSTHSPRSCSAKAKAGPRRRGRAQAPPRGSHVHALSGAHVRHTESWLVGWTARPARFVAEEETETAFNITVDTKPDDSRLKEYFNMCVKMKRYSQVLEEPEVDGARNDGALLQDIRRSYGARCLRSLPFGFRLSQPTAAVYVKSFN